MAMSQEELDYIKNMFIKMDNDQNGRVNLTEFLKGRYSYVTTAFIFIDTNFGVNPRILFTIHLIHLQAVVDKATPERRLGR